MLFPISFTSHRRRVAASNALIVQGFAVANPHAISSEKHQMEFKSQTF